MLANNRQALKFLVIIITFCVLLQASLLSNVSQVHAASSVNVSSGVSVSLYDAQMVTDETGKLAVFTIVFNNQSNNTVNLIDYWARVKGSSNKEYVTKLIAEDKDKKYVIPKTTTYMTFYAYVDEKEQLSNLKLDLIKWDFSMGNYERIIGSIKTSADGATPYKKAKEINLNKSLLNVLVSNYKMYTDNQYAYVSFETTVRNKANSGTDLNAIQFYLSDGKGTLIQLETSPKEIGLKPQERKSFILTGTINKTFANENLSIVVMYNDETVSFPKATMSLPKLTNTAVNKANVETTYNIDGTTIALTLKESVLSYPNKKAMIETKATFENKSNTRIAMPKFELFVKTAEGYLYPLTASSEAEEQIQNLLPKIPVTQTLQGEVPQDIKLSTSEIVVFVNNDESGKGNFLGTYKLLVGQASEEEKPESSRSTTYQEMHIEQASLQRIPSGINDLLIAEFKITNKGKQGKAKLDVTGQFELDGVKLSAESTTLVNLDKLVAVSPGQSYRVIAYTEIPYVQEASKIVFGMSEKAESGLKGIHSFEVSSMSNARLLASNQSYVIDTLGSRGEVSVLDSHVYTGKQTDLFVAKLVYTNKEQRAIVPTQLKGYVENSKLDIIDLDIKHYATKLLPNGQAIVYASALLPKKYEDKQIDLYFGETINGVQEDLDQVLINPVYTSYSPIAISPLDSFDSLKVSQYDLTLSNIQATLGSSDQWTIDGVDLNVEYDLVIRENAPAYSDTESIVIEYVDAQVPSVTFSKSFAVGNPEAESGLQLGTKRSAKISYNNPALGAFNMGTYHLNVYIEYKGHKKLIATKELPFGEINP